VVEREMGEDEGVGKNQKDISVKKHPPPPPPRILPFMR